MNVTSPFLPARISPLAAMMRAGEAAASSAVALSLAARDPTPLEAAIVEAAQHPAPEFLDGFAHALAAAHLAALAPAAASQKAAHFSPIRLD